MKTMMIALCALCVLVVLQGAEAKKPAGWAAKLAASKKPSMGKNKPSSPTPRPGGNKGPAKNKPFNPRNNKGPANNKPRNPRNNKGPGNNKPFNPRNNKGPAKLNKGPPARVPGKANFGKFGSRGAPKNVGHVGVPKNAAGATNKRKPGMPNKPVMPRTLKLGATGPWSHLRFTATKIRGQNHAHPFAQVGEFEFFNSKGVISGITATNPGGNNPSGEGPAQAVDGSLRTKWLDKNNKPIIFALPGAQLVDSFNFATGFDSGNIHRDPVQWVSVKRHVSHTLHLSPIFPSLSSCELIRGHPLPRSLLRLLIDLTPPLPTLIPTSPLTLLDA
jgi:hypothetical protein